MPFRSHKDYDNRPRSADLRTRKAAILPTFLLRKVASCSYPSARSLEQSSWHRLFDGLPYKRSTSPAEFSRQTSITKSIIMRSSILLTAGVGLASCFAAPTSNHGPFELHEKRDGAPHQWTKRLRALPDDILPVRIGLTESNLHRAEEYMLDVSDPRSPNFGTLSPGVFTYFFEYLQQ